MQFVQKSREIETLVSISIQQKVLQLLQARLQSFWPESVTNSLRDFSEKFTAEADSLRMGSSQSVEWLTRITEGLLEFDYWTLQILLMRSRLETVSPNMQSTRSRTANGRRFRSFQRLIDEMQAMDPVGGSQIYFIIFTTNDQRRKDPSHL